MGEQQQDILILPSCNEQETMEEGKESQCPTNSPTRISPTCKTMLQKAGAELVSTFILVFAGCGAVVVDGTKGHLLTLVGIALAFGLVVSVLIYATGHISGCHMNPAVSIALASVGLFEWPLVPVYIAAQCLGAIAASFALRLIFHPIAHLGATSPTGSNLQSLVVEIVITFILMFVVMGSTEPKAVPGFAGLAIGAIITVNALIAGPVSGASMNPARSLGPAVATSFLPGFWIYVVGPVVGALGGAWTYQIMRIP